jgi:hypothetical protein
VVAETLPPDCVKVKLAPKPEFEEVLMAKPVGAVKAISAVKYDPLTE